MYNTPFSKSLLYVSSLCLNKKNDVVKYFILFALEGNHPNYDNKAKGLK